MTVQDLKLAIQKDDELQIPEGNIRLIKNEQELTNKKTLKE